ncbi:MAG TPA: ATP phosphoribosyltransferase [Anaerolineales bacterium]|nr:ATP phosphoribosyltransferase [Anaerolineales bacterium]
MTIRIGVPSKGRLQEDVLQLLDDCGLKVYRPNERAYQARIPALPDVEVVFQRATDIVLGVRAGGLHFGITGLDVTEEYRGDHGQVVVIHEALGFGKCNLEVAVPENWKHVNHLNDLRQHLTTLGRQPRLATKFEVLTERFLQSVNFPSCRLVHTEGTLEITPALGVADFIVDLVSSGQTLRDNRMKTLQDGVILRSQAAFIGNRERLQEPAVLDVARQLLEFFEAHLRAEGYYSLIANIRGASAEAIAERILNETDFGGLQGPTISRVIDRNASNDLFAISLIVPKVQIANAVRQFRQVGGSGMVVLPVNYIFEEEPQRWRALLSQLAL